MEWRRGTESNRRMGLLQSPALPLGYPAIPFPVIQSTHKCHRGTREALINPRFCSGCEATAKQENEEEKETGLNVTTENNPEPILG